MQNQLDEQAVQCPYCWESITVLVDPSAETQNYIEDCQVCCRPIVFDITVDYMGGVTVMTKSEDD